jgi:hypothetical protein
MMRVKSAIIDNSSAQLTARSMIARHGLDKAQQLAERFAVQAWQKQAREFWVRVAAEIAVHKTPKKTQRG